MCTTGRIDLAFRLYESAVMHTTSQGRDNCGCSPGANLLGVHVSAQPIWIGLLEAAAMATELEGIKPQRPMTHDLLRNLLAELGGTVESIEVTELRPVPQYVLKMRLGAADGTTIKADVGGSIWKIGQSRER